MIKIFSADQIRKIDQYTIKHEPIASIDLMERASEVFTRWLIEYIPDTNKKIAVVAGTGNNGGDALAVARMLHSKGYNITSFLCRISNSLSVDCQSNLERLPISEGIKYKEINKSDDFPDLSSFDLIIDGIFGSGLNRPVEGYWGDLIDHINQTSAPIYSIDIPSGLFADKPSEGKIIQADHVLSFEFPKPAFLFPENEIFVKHWECRSIGLSQEIIQKEVPFGSYLDESSIRSLLKSRSKFQHKGHFGHALITGGSLGKMGAVHLAASACLRTGAGLVTCYIPACGYDIIQTSVPEAMVLQDENENYLREFKTDLDFDTAGIGCGMDKGPAIKSFLKSVLNYLKTPVVLDADALNNISENSELISQIPRGSILTPHLKEFSRLFGVSHNDFERHELQKKMSRDYNCVIVLKGAHSCISTPKGEVFFNSTGNPGMATAGSGDVLTGIITGFLSQGYSSRNAAILGVYIHGLAGDLAARALSEEAMISSDIIEYLPKAFKKLTQEK